jgi:hypothetical protein
LHHVSEYVAEGKLSIVGRNVVEWIGKGHTRWVGGDDSAFIGRGSGALEPLLDFDHKLADLSGHDELDEQHKRDEKKSLERHKKAIEIGIAACSSLLARIMRCHGFGKGELGLIQDGLDVFGLMGAFSRISLGGATVLSLGGDALLGSVARGATVVGRAALDLSTFGVLRALGKNVFASAQETMRLEAQSEVEMGGKELTRIGTLRSENPKNGEWVTKRVEVRAQDRIDLLGKKVLLQAGEYRIAVDERDGVAVCYSERGPSVTVTNQCCELAVGETRMTMDAKQMLLEHRAGLSVRVTGNAVDIKGGAADLHMSASGSVKINGKARVSVNGNLEVIG